MAHRGAGARSGRRGRQAHQFRPPGPRRGHVPAARGRLIVDANAWLARLARAGWPARRHTAADQARQREQERDRRIAIARQEIGVYIYNHLALHTRYLARDGGEVRGHTGIGVQGIVTLPGGQRLTAGLIIRDNDDIVNARRRITALILAHLAPRLAEADGYLDRLTPADTTHEDLAQVLEPLEANLRLQALADHQAELERRYAERRKANARANALLRSILPPYEVGRLQERREIELDAGPYRWRLLGNRSYSGNVLVLGRGGAPMWGLCFYPDDAADLPLADVLLAQYLSIRADPFGVLQIAVVQPCSTEGIERQAEARQDPLLTRREIIERAEARFAANRRAYDYIRLG